MNIWQQKKKINYNLKGQGRKVNTIEIEDELCSFIKQCNSLGITISATEIINEALKLDSNLKDKSSYTLHSQYYRFIRRNGFLFV